MRTPVGILMLVLGATLTLPHASARPTEALLGSTFKSRTLFYTIERDLRRCVSPLCGGYFVRAVNHDLTTCPDGSRQERCYVADLDWSVSGLSPAQIRRLEADIERVVALARIVRKKFAGFGNLGALRVGAAWFAATTAEARGSFFRVEDLGFVCVTYPCFNTRAHLLNTTRFTDVSGLDLSAAGATDEQVAAALEAAAAGRLLIAGAITRDAVTPPDNRAGVTLSASQLYLPIEPVVAECVVDSDCTTSVYLSPVRSPDECYCPLCPGPISVREAAANEAQWQRYCADWKLICPLVPCAEPLPVACIDDRCVSAAR